MATISSLPNYTLEVSDSIEVNFVIQEFLKLPTDTQRSLAEGLSCDIKSKEFIEAGIELFNLIETEDGEALTRFANEVLYDGDHVLDGYFINPDSWPFKAFLIAVYFKDNVKHLPEAGYQIAEAPIKCQSV
jgi:hypothetical protein